MRWYKDRVILNLLKSPLHVATREHCKHDGVVWKGPYTEYLAIGGGWRVIKEGRSGTSIISFVKGLKKENRVRASRHKEPVTLREPGYVTYHMLPELPLGNAPRTEGGKNTMGCRWWVHGEITANDARERGTQILEMAMGEKEQLPNFYRRIISSGERRDSIELRRIGSRLAT